MKNNKFVKRLSALLLALSMVCVMSATALAADVCDEQDDVQVTSTSENYLYNVSFPLSGDSNPGYWGNTIHVPKSGTYKIVYTIMAEVDSNPIRLYVDTSSWENPTASGNGRVSGIVTKYYSAGSSINLGVYLQPLALYALTFMIYEA